MRQTASGCGQSNQELQRTPGRWGWGVDVGLCGGQAPLNSYCVGPLTTTPVLAES
jgi:hypothetical protein